ncbi:hypothetical protein EHV15_34380 [Paenibacillus oralis]|uniref:Uncharacterized protein n=1 Tax=Paenibacillus oralis TaxID=2490856 RepID=A0A3P3T9I5_9BACL|nr:hypothetical protein [Paenibacillus oralis]RRJ54687.1 hypothetical protein EHV15_34380 [Paenibacillus oralis]
MAKNLVLTCSLCANYCPNTSKCRLNDEPRKAYDSSFAETCKENGGFIRYIHVIPDVYNYYSMSEDTPPNWTPPDLKRIPTDRNGLPLVVKTKRGLERAIPADSSVILEVETTIEGKVSPITTYQGQREIIYEIGVKLAAEEASKAGVPLTVLPDERDWEGIPEHVYAYLGATKKYNRGGKAWLTDKPVQWNY